MKKSRSLTVAYILFLISAPIICKITESGVLANIAIAATVSGGVFAITDMLSSLSSAQEKMLVLRQSNISFLHESCEKLRESFDRSKEKLAERDAKSERTTAGPKEQAILDVFYQGEERVSKGIEYAEDYIKSEAKRISKSRSRWKWVDRGTGLLVVVGYFLFFCLSVFEVFASWVQSMGASITIYAFGIIVANYFLRDYFTEKIDNDYHESEEACAEFGETLETNEETLETMHMALNQIDSQKEYAKVGEKE